jgi:hypothetical protein
MTGQEFIHAMEQLKSQGELKTTIRLALQELMGEMSATIALAYVGDAQEGNLASFVLRTEEFFGTGAPMILSSIVSAAGRTAKTD